MEQNKPAKKGKNMLESIMEKFGDTIVGSIENVSQGGVKHWVYPLGIPEILEKRAARIMQTNETYTSEDRGRLEAYIKEAAQEVYAKHEELAKSGAKVDLIDKLLVPVKMIPGIGYPVSLAEYFALKLPHSIKHERETGEKVDSQDFAWEILNGGVEFADFLGLGNPYANRGMNYLGEEVIKLATQKMNAEEAGNCLEIKIPENVREYKEKVATE